jgi:hypothetical protein
MGHRAALFLRSAEFSDSVKKGEAPDRVTRPTFQSPGAPGRAHRRWAARRTVPLSNSRTAPTLNRESTCWRWPDEDHAPRGAPPTSAACDRFSHSANANTYSLFLWSTTGAGGPGPRGSGCWSLPAACGPQRGPGAGMVGRGPEGCGGFLPLLGQELRQSAKGLTHLDPELRPFLPSH